MTTLDVDLVELPRVRLSEIHDHPANPRRQAIASDGMVESIRSQGVLEPLMVAPRAEGGWWLIDGHRRKNGAIRAGVAEVPVNPRRDLDSDTQQIQAMIITGLQKEHLTPVEEAAAYEQLHLAGMDAAAIAEATGFSRARVRGRLRLNELSDTARDHVHDGQLTLLDAEALLEFADDPDTLARLEESLGGGNFSYELTLARGRRAREAGNRKLVAEFEALGAARAEAALGNRLLLSWPEGAPAREPAAHDTCLRWVLPGGDWSGYGGPRLVCVDPERHPGPDKPSSATPVDAGWEARQAARDAEHAARIAASRARADWIRQHIEAVFPTRLPNGLGRALQAVLPLLLTDGREPVDPDLLVHVLGYSDPTGGAEQTLAAEAAAVGAAKVARITPVFSRWVAGLIADQLDVGQQWLSDPTEIRHHLTLWDWLKSTGYQLSDADRAHITRLESRYTETSDEAETG